MPSAGAFISSALLILSSYRGCSVRALPPVRRAVSTQVLTSDTIMQNVASSGITLVASSTVASLPGTSGSVPTSLETEGRPSSMPFATASITPPFATVLGIGVSGFTATTAVALSVNPKVPAAAAAAAGDVDPFLPVATGAPPSQIASLGGHPIARLGIVAQDAPLCTNKFYANLFLGTQGQGVWTHPYSVSWSQGTDNSKSWGLAVQHIDASQRSFGAASTNIPGGPATNMVNPIGLQSVVLSAAELSNGTTLTTDSLETFSANANLVPAGSTTSSIKFPLVQGMAFVTAIYDNLTPVINSGIFFQAIVAAGSPQAGVFKYRITLADGKSWLMYAMPSDGTDPAFTMTSNVLLQGPVGWSGTIQVTKNPSGTDGEAVFDKSAGVYAMNATVSGSVNAASGTYSIAWTKAGLSTGQSLMMFALPHLISSFDTTTKAALTTITLATTTKGNATAIVADRVTMVESSLPEGMGFAPWSPANGTTTKFSTAAISAIMAVASSEINQDMGAQSNLNSMYYAGKALSKFASIVYTVHDIAAQPDLATIGLAQLKTAFATFATNKQIFPLVYDTDWKGVVSSASYAAGDAGADFGNSVYNDHHFHYGYFIHAAAIIGYLDSTWLATNQDWVNALVRDVSNPSPTDPYFPVFRSFDWFHGHSWAKGLFESGDSKDEESSSEDVMFAYALKMWGKTVADASMEARGNLMLSVLARSLQHYFLMASDNVVQPSNLIGNKVTGIMFENKIDHVTYFGANYEYTQGIHMVPLTAASTLTRTQAFVTEEWATYFADGAVDPASNVTGGWRGILYANLAIVDPVASFNFFSSSTFDPSWLDGGASQIWYLAFAAGLGGA